MARVRLTKGAAQLGQVLGVAIVKATSGEKWTRADSFELLGGVTDSLEKGVGFVPRKKTKKRKAEGGRSDE